jgi:hypothetical protein
MEEKFYKYLESIGIGEPITKKVEELYIFYEEMLKKNDDAIIDMFITDYIKQDGSRVFENLWFFSNKYMMESKLFINKDDLDFLATKNGVIYVNIKKENYDYKNAQEQSRLIVEYVTSHNAGGILKASKENCNKLRDIINDYIIPLTN